MMKWGAPSHRRGRAPQVQKRGSGPLARFLDSSRFHYIFFAAQGFFAAHGFLAAQGFLAAHGFLAAQGLAFVAVFFAQRKDWPSSQSCSPRTGWLSSRSSSLHMGWLPLPRTGWPPLRRTDSPSPRTDSRRRKGSWPFPSRSSSARRAHRRQRHQDRKGPVPARRQWRFSGNLNGNSSGCLLDGWNR